MAHFILEVRCSRLPSTAAAVEVELTSSLSQRHSSVSSCAFSVWLALLSRSTHTVQYRIKSVDPFILSMYVYDFGPLGARVLGRLLIHSSLLLPAHSALHTQHSSSGYIPRVASQAA